MTNDTTAPERIWANLNVSPVGVVLQGTLTIEPSEIVAQVEYVRADLPAAVTVKQIEDALRDYKQLDELLCCSGFDIYGQVGCGCQGVTLREEIAHRILSALTPGAQPDAVQVKVVADADLSQSTIAEYVIQSGDAGLYHLYGSDGVFISRHSVQECLDALPIVKREMDAALRALKGGE